jgi:DNA-binding NarL/FixJ family response regulator
MTIRVVLVDDQALVRSGFAMLVNSQPDLEVVGEAGDGDKAIELLERLAADVVLMDVRMPRLDGVEATRRIVGSRPAGAGGPRVVVLTTFDLDEYAFAALQAGASGFLLKDAMPEDLLRAIRSVHAGDAVVAPSTTKRLIAHYVQRAPLPPAPTSVETLTEREREVWLAIARGLTNGEIAEALFVSEATVKTHVGNILAKTGMRDRVALVVLAYECGAIATD